MKLFRLIRNFFVKKTIEQRPPKTDVAPVFGKTHPFEIAKNELGVKERPGPESEPRIIEYLATCDRSLKQDSIAWCSAFVNWCFDKANLSRTKNAVARSWVNWGSSTKNPKAGDIVVLGYKNSWRGHVGFFVKETKTKVLVLGGNQNNKVCYQWYSKKGFKLSVLDYRTFN